MAIHQMLRGAAFDPEALTAMTKAYEEVLQELKLRDRSNGLTEIVARKIIECAQTGEPDLRRLRDVVLKSLAS
jgi:hypothetical protein